MKRKSQRAESNDGLVGVALEFQLAPVIFFMLWPHCTPGLVPDDGMQFPELQS
jgi:hypothetical protein